MTITAGLARRKTAPKGVRHLSEAVLPAGYGNTNGNVVGKHGSNVVGNVATTLIQHRANVQTRPWQYAANTSANVLPTSQQPCSTPLVHAPKMPSKNHVLDAVK